MHGMASSEAGLQPQGFAGVERQVSSEAIRDI